jgi:hypothetical protein
MKFLGQHLTPRQIAKGSGLSAKTVIRRARRENWPAQPHGNRFKYRPRVGLIRKDASVIDCNTSLLNILNKPETIRALDRAAVVNGFVRELKQNQRSGIERALTVTVARFSKLMPFSVRVLRRWIASTERHGLGALHEHKLGRVGRRSNQLHKILK